MLAFNRTLHSAHPEHAHLQPIIRFTMLQHHAHRQPIPFNTMPIRRPSSGHPLQPSSIFSPSAAHFIRFNPIPSASTHLQAIRRPSAGHLQAIRRPSASTHPLQHHAHLQPIIRFNPSPSTPCPSSAHPQAIRRPSASTILNPTAHPLPILNPSSIPCYNEPFPV